MRQWVQKLIDQLDDGWAGKENGGPKKPQADLSEDRATLLYLLDVYNKHLIDIDAWPVRKVRDMLDEYAKELVQPDSPKSEKTLFRLRQFFASYRVEESAYVKKTFDDFKNIIWDFVDQLSTDFQTEKADDVEVTKSLYQLREAVEAESIDTLRSKSREFIDFYIEHQTRRDDRRAKRMKTISGSLNNVKKQLDEANRSMRLDHLTQANNRRSFDEKSKECLRLRDLSGAPSVLVLMDIDHFKKVNDTYGHDVGDFVLKECVRLLQEGFGETNDFVARTGGEEFALLLSGQTLDHVIPRLEAVMAAVRKEVIVHDGHEIRFTISMGVAPLLPTEGTDLWMKRADTALYESKHGGRNRYTVSVAKTMQVA